MKEQKFKFVKDSDLYYQEETKTQEVRDDGAVVTYLNRTWKLATAPLELGSLKIPNEKVKAFRYRIGEKKQKRGLFEDD